MFRPSLPSIARRGMGNRPSQATLLRLLPRRTTTAYSAPLASSSSGTPLPYYHHARRTFIIRHRPSNSPARNLGNNLNVQQILKQQQKYQHSRLAFLSAALLASMIWAGVTAYRLWVTIQEDRAQAREQARGEEARKEKTSGVGGAGFRTDGVDVKNAAPSAVSDGKRENGGGGRGGSGKIQADALPNSTPVPVGSKVIIHNPDGADLVPTGNNTVKHFPRTVRLPGTSSTGEDEVEYTLVGLGIRTVSFLQFSVYVVGLYIATQDISGVQERLVKKINPLASALVPSERGELKTRLEDPTRAGEELWEEAVFPARTALRIAPVRDTNFPHLRDGFVRAISHRRDVEATKDDEFGRNMRSFKQAFNHGKLHQCSELVMQRDPKGTMRLSFVDAKGSGKRVLMATIEEPRLSRLLWLNYLTGNVASPPARESIVQGVMDFVGRPVGTVAAQVV